jgi:predicted dehydrogenase
MASEHIDAIQSNPNAEVIYICSRDMKRAEEFAKYYGLIPTKAYENILNDKSINAIDIVTEPSRHANLALEAIKNSKHVLIEKPLEIDMVLAEKIMTASVAASTVTSVISQKRFEPRIIDMKKELNDRAIGMPYLSVVQLMWRRTNKYYNKGNGWRGREGNVLINQAIHWIDIALWFFGIPIQVKSLTTKVKEDIACYDTAICCLKFSNNLLFNLVCSTAVNRSQRNEFIIYGTNGVLDYNVKKYHTLSKAINFLKPYKTPLRCQIDDFIDSIVRRKPPQVSIQDAFNALKIVKACEEQNGKS